LSYTRASKPLILPPVALSQQEHDGAMRPKLCAGPPAIREFIREF